MHILPLEEHVNDMNPLTSVGCIVMQAPIIRSETCSWSVCYPRLTGDILRFLYKLSRESADVSDETSSHRYAEMADRRQIP
jgi:hypothetical protein